ncbi:MAG: hypothetical protein U0264_14840 [Candidatus Kapaibacterium sp.]
MRQRTVNPTNSKRPGSLPGRFAFLILLFCMFGGIQNACTAARLFSGSVKICAHHPDSSAADSLTVHTTMEEAELDSLEAELDAFEAELDDMEEDSVETKWSLSAGSKYRSQEQRSGVDISNGLPTLNTSVAIAHAIGVELSASTSHRIKSSKLDYQDFTLGLSYVYEAADWVDFTAGLTRTKYQSDTTNALAGSSLIISLMMDFYIKSLILDVSIDRFTGEDASTALSVSAIYPFKYKEVTITPMLSTSLLSYEITTKRLQALAKATNTTAKTKKAFSLSSIVVSLPLSYPLYKGFSLNCTPSFSYSPIKDVSGNRTQFVLNAGIKYSIDW